MQTLKHVEFIWMKTVYDCLIDCFISLISLKLVNLFEAWTLKLVWTLCSARNAAPDERCKTRHNRAMHSCIEHIETARNSDVAARSPWCVCSSRTHTTPRTHLAAYLQRLWNILRDNFALSRFSSFFHVFPTFYILHLYAFVCICMHLYALVFLVLVGLSRLEKKHIQSSLNLVVFPFALPHFPFLHVLPSWLPFKEGVERTIKNLFGQAEFLSSL